MKLYNDFNSAIKSIRTQLQDYGHVAQQQTWQSVPIDKGMFEVYNVSFSVPMTSNISLLNDEVKPNQPWADVHFKERVSGIPLNPGESYKAWPFYGRDKEMRTEGEQFSHTYMERFWPKRAGMDSNSTNIGIRYEYGDLNSIINLLEREPNTRQAYLPIFFPEDTGNENNVRVPCTLGYLFTQREGFLHMIYYIRSCDYLRHFRDDIYLAVRLNLWLLEQLKGRNDWWKNVKPGVFTMHIASLHVFDIEKNLLQNK